MKMKKWLLEQTREDDDPHYPSSSRVSVALTGADRTSYQVREPIENDDRLAMKKGDVPPPVPERVANLRIRKDQATTITHKHGLIIAELSSRNPSKKTGTNVDIYNVPAYQCSILFNNMGSFTRKSEFRKPESLDKPITKGEKFNVDELSLLTEFWRNNDAHVILTPEADSLPTDEKKLLEDSGLVGYSSSRSNDL